MFFSRNTGVGEQLSGKLVSIVGCGSFGSALADMLVRAGLGKIILIDPELLSIENIGRHVLTSRDVGRAKVDALAERLREINPELDVDARRQRFQDAEGLLLCCADSRRCESMVNAVALEKRLPAAYVGAYGAVRAGEVQFYVPDKTPCRECFARGGLDFERPLWIVNLDYEGFQPFAVTFAKVARGCAVCDESKVAELTLDESETRST